MQNIAVFVVFSVFLLKTDVVHAQQEGDLRLRGPGSNTTHGRVEIFHAGRWGTICSDVFKHVAAQVACIQLGFPTDGSGYIKFTYGQGLDPIWVNHVECIGTEQRLLDCKLGEWGPGDCSHIEDVGVRCQSLPEPTPTSTIPWVPDSGASCENGTYGSNCRLSCGHCYGDQPCNKVDGTCERCDRGYLGDLCVTECKAGTYGQDCSTLCGFCFKYEACNHVTGLCSKGCAAGCHGETCKKVCGNSTFGVNCKQQCHCLDDTSCDSIYGECGNGFCAENFFGADCQQIKGDPDENDGNNQGLIIGVLIGVACIIIALVVAGVCFLKRRKRNDESPEIVTKPKDEHHYEDLHIN